MSYLDDADGLPGEVEAGVEQEGEDEGESSVPARRGHERAALRARLKAQHTYFTKTNIQRGRQGGGDRWRGICVNGCLKVCGRVSCCYYVMSKYI